MLKLILGVVVGVIAIMALVMGGEFVLHALLPTPVYDPNDPIAVGLAATGGATAKFGLIVVYLIASLGAAFVAARVAAKRLAGWIVTVIMIALTIANFVMLPHPVWIIAASLVLIAVGGWFGARSGAKA